MLRTRCFLGLSVLSALALSGCATLPTGPSVMVLPAPGKPFEEFQAETRSAGSGRGSKSACRPRKPSIKTRRPERSSGRSSGPVLGRRSAPRPGTQASVRPSGPGAACWAARRSAPTPVKPTDGTPSGGTISRISNACTRKGTRFLERCSRIDGPPHCRRPLRPRPAIVRRRPALRNPSRPRRHLRRGTPRFRFLHHRSSNRARCAPRRPPVLLGFSLERTQTACYSSTGRALQSATGEIR